MAEGGDSPKNPVPQDNQDDKKENEEEDSLSGGDARSTSEWLLNLMKSTLRLDDKPKPQQLLEEVTFEGIIKYMKSDKCKRVITMAGAGISTSAGIPDFRSPGTGLYDNLQKYNLPNPQAIFEINFFRENPEPFFMLAKELFPTEFKPTPCHYFLRLLHEKGHLLRHFTQNIDTLEHVAGLAAEKIVEAHGTFHTSHCLHCGRAFTQEWMKERIFADLIPTCDKESCDGLVKPDIVFFGEQLPPRFFSCVQNDLPNCDLLIIMGTSLVVQPFASVISRVPDTTPRLYINLEKSACDPMMAMLGMGHDLMFDSENNYRDVFWQGTSDDGCYELADKLGWGDELRNLVKSEHEKIDKEKQKDSEKLKEGKKAPKPASSSETKKAGDGKNPVRKESTL